MIHVKGIIITCIGIDIDHYHYHFTSLKMFRKFGTSFVQLGFFSWLDSSFEIELELDAWGILHLVSFLGIFVVIEDTTFLFISTLYRVNWDIFKRNQLRTDAINRRSRASSLGQEGPPGPRATGAKGHHHACHPSII